MQAWALWLQRNGHEPTIVAGHTKSERYEIDGVPYRTVRAFDWSKRQRELTPAVTMIPAMALALRRLKPDVVHAFSYHDAIAARLAGLPYVITYGGIIVPASWQRAPRQFRLFRSASRHAKALICPSQAAADALKRDYSFSSVVIPHGLWTESFAPTTQTERGRILCAATPDDSRKRPEVLVDAFALVAQDEPDASLWFAGQASATTQEALRNRLPETARHRLHFLGNLDQAALIDEFGRAQMTALTSVNEAFGLVLIESLATGTPVVATRSGAVPEIVDDTTGALFEPADAAGAAQAIRGVMSADVAALENRCRARAARYHWDSVGPAVTDLYASVLK